MQIRNPIMKKVAAMAKSPKVAARLARSAGLDVTANDVREIARIQSSRKARRHVNWRLKATTVERLKWRRQCAMREAQNAIQSAERQHAAAAAADIRATLLAAAACARAMGLTVRASKDRQGRVSSYYVEGNGCRVRVSDHEIPSTAMRDAIARAHGASEFTGYHGPQILIDQPRRKEWLRRAIILALHGREIGNCY